MQINIPYEVNMDLIKDIMENTRGYKPSDDEIERKIKEFIVEIASTISDEWLTSNDIEIEIVNIIYPEDK